MAKTGKLWFLALLMLLCAGPVRATAEDHVVTQVQVRYRQSGRQLTREYTQSSKMEAVLNYLRLCEYAGMPADDPEQHMGNRCRITVSLAGGGQHVYCLHADRYLSRDFRPWEQVDPPSPILELLLSLPPDG